MSEKYYTKYMISGKLESGEVVSFKPDSVLSDAFVAKLKLTTTFDRYFEKGYIYTKPTETTETTNSDDSGNSSNVVMHTFSFYDNTGKLIEDIEVIHGENVKVPSWQAPSGYKIKGIFTTKGGSKAAVLENITANSEAYFQVEKEADTQDDSTNTTQDDSTNTTQDDSANATQDDKTDDSTATTEVE